jgi:hypothetical protein
MLSNAFEEENKLNLPKLTIPKPPKQIAKPANQEQILEEMACLKKGDYRLLQSKNYEVYFVTADKIPNILH